MNENDNVSTGDVLEEARRRKGVSLEEAGRRTLIPVHYLRGLEREDTAALPDPVYARVFLKTYADYLGLDGTAVSGRAELDGKVSGIGRRKNPQRSGAPVIVEAHGVSKSYRTEEVVVHALDDVSISIERGALVAVMGPSGCGKTTLLNTLSGLDSVDRGEIFIAGEPLHALSDSRRTEHRARNMGFIFQSFNLMPVLSAVENVELPLLVSGAGVRRARERAMEVLEQVRLADRAHHRPGQLSGGQQQRVAIARALVNQPAIVWADEPTGNLDSDTSREVLDLILHLNRENGQTFVIVTHDPGVGALADRIVRMSDGRVTGSAVG